MGSQTTKIEASTTAVESLLRTLDDSARWDGRPASRVRAFTRRRSTAGPVLGTAVTRIRPTR